MGLFGFGKKKQKPMVPSRPVEELVLEAGALFEEGRYEAAIRLYQEAAERGNTASQYVLGLAYRDGDSGVAKNMETAVFWLEKAANAGHVKAQYAAAEICDSKLGDKQKAFRLYERAAKQGHGTAQNNLAMMYEYGTGGCPKDEETAAYWYEKSARQNVAVGQFNYGRMLYNGIGMQADQDMAFLWFRRAAEQGIAQAAFNCGWMLDTGAGVSHDSKKAAEWYRKAADLGSKDAMTNLGILFDQGDGVPQDPAEAKQWYEKAAAQGEERAARRLAELQEIETQQRMAEEAKRDAEEQARRTEAAAKQRAAEETKRLLADAIAAMREKQYDTALPLFQRHAEDGNAKAQYFCGVLYGKGAGTERDYAKALYWLEKAGEQGELKAQLACAKMYLSGQGGIEKNYEKAFYWSEKAAEQGDEASQELCLKMVQNGVGTEKSDAKELYWLEKKASKGDRDAQIQCGKLCISNDGKDPDIDRAIFWYEKAADQGDADAQLIFGKLYLYAEGLDNDREKAAKAVAWLEREAEQGRSDAQYFLGMLYGMGKGVPADGEKAKAWLQKAAEQGDEEAKRAMYALGELDKQRHDRLDLLYGELTAAQAAYEAGDYAKALQLFEKLAERGGSLPQLMCGLLYLQGKGTEQDDEKALHWLLKAAGAGFVQADYYAGMVLYQKEDAPQEEREKGLQMIQKAAELNVTEAQSYLGTLYSRRYFADKNDIKNAEKALYWNERAAAAGDAEAKWLCGFYYEEGITVKKDGRKAAQFYKESAEGGFALGQIRYAIALIAGEDVPRDLVTARKWLQKAAAGENKVAQVLAADMLKTLDQ